MNVKFENDILRLVKEIKEDEKNIIFWGGLDEAKIKLLEKAINRKMKLIELLQRGEA